MEELQSFGFDEFAIEMEDFEVKQTRKHDRMWKVEEGGSIIQIPLVHDNVVYFGAMNRILYALDVKTGKNLWQYKTQGMILESCPCHYEGKIYVGSFDKHIHCVDEKTGKLIWKFETSGRINCSPHIWNGKVYIGSEDQNMYCLSAETGKLVWKFRTYDEIQSFPVVDNGKIFFGSFDYNFYCLDAETGRLIWKVPTQGNIFNLNRPLIRDGIVYFGSFDNIIRAVRISDGIILWKLKIGNYGNVCCPQYHEGHLYVSARDGILYKLTLEGKEVWKFVKNEQVIIPLIHKNRIYIGCEDQHLYCLDLDGKEIWKFYTQGMVALQSTAAGDDIVFSSYDCHIYTLNAETGKLIWKFRTKGDPPLLPPAFDTFEVVIKRSAEDKEENKKVGKNYDITLEDEENTSEYTSRITYQVSTQYSKKGKYQFDEKTEGF